MCGVYTCVRLLALPVRTGAKACASKCLLRAAVVSVRNGQQPDSDKSKSASPC